MIYKIDIPETERSKVESAFAVASGGGTVEECLKAHVLHILTKYLQEKKMREIVNTHVTAETRKLNEHFFAAVTELEG